MSSEKRVECIGITNRIPKSNHEKYVVFLDYDAITFDNLSKEVNKLIKRWDLGWTYVIQSNDDMIHWHVICPSIVSPYEYLGILWDSSCDNAYKKSFYTLKEKTLRISSKKDGRNVVYPIVHALFETETNRAYSTGHLKFVNQIHKAKIPICDNYEETTVEFVKYKTGHLNLKGVKK